MSGPPRIIPEWLVLCMAIAAQIIIAIGCIGCAAIPIYALSVWAWRALFGG